MRQLENPRDVPLFHVMQRRKRRAFDRHGNFARRVRTLLGRRGRLGNRIFGIDHGERQHLLEDTLARITRGATALPAGREFQLLELLEAPERGSDSCEKWRRGNRTSPALTVTYLTRETRELTAILVSTDDSITPT